MISSVGYTNKEIIGNILQLHIPRRRFHLDSTFSKGKFYKELPRPDIIGDIAPQDTDFGDGHEVSRLDSTCLPYDDSCIRDIMFDPPFCFGVHGKTLESKVAKRFTIFNNFGDLEAMYRESLAEFHRVLKPKGILVFKCQDYTDTRTTMTHCFVYNWAVEAGFYAKDLFVLVARARVFNPKLVQRHARKFHAYFWVFEKI